MHDGCMERRCGKEECGSNISSSTGRRTGICVQRTVGRRDKYTNERRRRHRSLDDRQVSHSPSPTNSTIDPHVQRHAGSRDFLGVVRLEGQVHIRSPPTESLLYYHHRHLLPGTPSPCALLPTASQPTVISSTCMRLSMTSCRSSGPGFLIHPPTVSINLDWAPHDTPTPRHGPDGVHLDIFFRPSDLPLTEEVSCDLRTWWHPYHTREELRYA